MLYGAGQLIVVRKEKNTDGLFFFTSIHYL